MTEKADQFIEGLGRLISDSKAVKDKVDVFELLGNDRERFLVIKEANNGISEKDVSKSQLTPIPKRLLASAMGETGAVHLQAYQHRLSPPDHDYGYLEVSAAVSRFGLEAMVGYSSADPSLVEIVLARNFFGGNDVEFALAIAVSGLLRENPNRNQHEDNALILLSLANEFLKKL